MHAHLNYIGSDHTQQVLCTRTCMLYYNEISCTLGTSADKNISA